MNQHLLDFDITRKRHRGNPNSEAAHERVKHTKRDMYRRILEWAGDREFTSRELCEAWDMTPNQISGRLSELKAFGDLIETGKRRDGCGVLRRKD